MEQPMKAYHLVSFILCTAFLVIFSNSAKAGDNPSQKLNIAKGMTENNPADAIKMIRQIISGLNPEKEPATVSLAYFLLGESYYYLDEIDSTIINYEKAIESDITYGNDKTPEHVNILGNLGYMYDSMDQKIIAMDYYQQALRIARETGLKDEIASNLANIAQLKTIQGYYQEAIENMEEALAIDREISEESIIATDLNTIGRIYESWGMYEQAVNYLERALEIDSSLNMADKMAIRYSSLGLVYKGWGKYNQALEYFRKALEIDQKLGNEDKVALRIANIGSTYIDMDQPDQAIIHLENSLKYFTDHKMPSFMASTLNELGRSYYLKKDYPKAEQAFLQSAAICRENDFARFLVTSLDYLSKIYRDSRQYEKAFGYLMEFNSLNDSIFNAETQKKVAEFNARYELDQKQQENELLVRDNELAKKRQIVSVLVFSSAGFFLVIILLTLFVRLKSQQNRRLITEKENERLRMDLEEKHKELTYNAMCIIKNNETVAKIAETLEVALQSGQDERSINNMVRKLQNMEREKNWTEFEVRFTKVHEDFYNKLITRFPDLSPNEKKLCAFLKLNMSTKDIAAITHQSVHSINVARTRMRKKLGIDQTDENLVNFLGSL
jgi:tetratricopeptide (TPR) repeat protein